MILFLLERMQRLQELRKQQLRETCSGDRETFSEGKQVLDDLSVKELENLVVDDKHGIIYCYIPKVMLIHTHSINKVVTWCFLQLV